MAEHADLVRVVREQMADEIHELASLIQRTIAGGGKILLCGNGGSAADAQHLAAEFVSRLSNQRSPLPALALTTDSSVLTAVGNDLGFVRVFEVQVRALAAPGDLLVIHSTSGESENLLMAARAASELGVRTAALLAKGGGRLGRFVDQALVVPTDSTQRAQEIHIIIGHVLCELVAQSEAGLDGSGALG